MPIRPPSPCPTCGTLTPRGRCTGCTRRSERLRGTASSRGYDRDWEDLRAYHLRYHPLCERCGVLPDRPEVDHIESVEDAPHRRLDSTNLRTLCKPCHSKRTYTEQGLGRSVF